MLISVLQPGRGRPEKTIRGIVSLIEQAADTSKIEFIFRFDEDDQNTSNKVITYFDENYPDLTFKYIIGTRHGYIHMEKYWDELTDYASGEYCLTWTDDNEMNPDNKGHWDESIREAEGQLYLLDFPDTTKMPPYDRWPSVTPYPKKLYKIMGNRLCPNLKLDKWFIRLLKENDIWVRCPEKILHHQVFSGRAEQDKTYDRGRGHYNKTGTGNIDGYKDFDEEDAKKLKNYLEKNPNSIKFETDKRYLKKELGGEGI